MSSVCTQGVLLVAYSGHRQLAEPARAASAIEAVLDRLQAAADQRKQHFVGIGSAAIGADTLVLESLKRRGCGNLLKMPFAVERFEPDASDEERRRCMALIESSSAVEFAQHGLSDRDAFLEAGLQTVEDVDVLVAVWDGEASRGKGGTAQVVTAARALGVPIVRIDPSTGDVAWPDDLDLDAAPGGDDDDAAKACEVFALNRDGVTQMFSALDGEAIRVAPQARLLLFRVILLHLVATAVTITAVMTRIEGLAEHAVSVFEGAALIWALALAVAQRNRSRDWLDSRYRAELCRSFLAIWSIEREALLKLPHPTTSGGVGRFHRDLELTWRLNARDATSLDEAREAYLNSRLIDQRNWMAAKGKRAASVQSTLHRIAITTTITAIACGALALAFSLSNVAPDARHWLKMCAMLLPLAGAAIFSFSVSYDLTRRSTRYSELAEQLTMLERRTRVSGTWPTLGRAVAETEALLLNELGEWHAMMRFAGRPH